MEASVVAQVAGSGSGTGSMSGSTGPLSGTQLERDIVRLTRIPTTIADLAVLTHHSRREIEEAVETLRLRGEPIVGGNDGLRLTEDPAELAAYLEARRRRTAHIHRGTMRLRSTLRRMRERSDLTLFGDAA